MRAVLEKQPSRSLVCEGGREREHMLYAPLRVVSGMVRYDTGKWPDHVQHTHMCTIHTQTHITMYHFTHSLTKHCYHIATIYYHTICGHPQQTCGPSWWTKEDGEHAQTSLLNSDLFSFFDSSQYFCFDLVLSSLEFFRHSLCHHLLHSLLCLILYQLRL